MLSIERGGIRKVKSKQAGSGEKRSGGGGGGGQLHDDHVGFTFSSMRDGDCAHSSTESKPARHTGHTVSD